MLIPIILSVYLLSHLNLPIFLLVTLTLNSTPTHARTLHRWGSLVPAHAHVPAIDASSDPGLDSTLPIPGTAADEISDDWQKWHHERHLQQDMRRKLECRSVEFGRCEVQRQRRGEEVDVVTEETHEHEHERQEEEHVKEDDEFVGKRLPRHLQDWLTEQQRGGI